MPSQRRARSLRPLTLASALLLSSAIAAPAFAQIEEVVVTAQKKSEDAQTVPIAMSALSDRDLKEHQVAQFQDLQFSTPNVSYTKGNFTGSDFQIRGIGITAVGWDSESGVAINFDDIYLSAPPLAESAFYDLDRIEVLRGPQSTLYGRGATGGVVSVYSAKPDLESFMGHLEASYGNYNAKELKGWVNIPVITDKLGLRIAGDWVKHSGFTKNIFNNSHIDDRDQYSVRSSVRWQPNQNTTVDFVASFSNENDHKMRSQKQLCASDPTGTLGCLPNSLAAQPVNLNSNLSAIASSMQGMQAAVGGKLGAAAAGALGLFDLTATPSLPAGYADPADPRTISTDFNPTYRAQDNFLAGEWKQSWSSWLDSTLAVGYDNNSVHSQESYNNIPGLPINPTRMAVAEGTLMAIIGNPLYGGSAAYASHYAPFFTTVPGSLPISGTKNLGIIGGNIQGYSPNVTAYDQSDGTNSQYSGELRFNTRFEGPLNFMLAGYYLHTHTTGNYFVNSNTLDYPGIVLGALSGLAAPGLCAATGCIYGPSFYHNDGYKNTLTSKAIFGEAYYTAIPDTLKFTVGLRWTEDQKFQQGRIALLSGLIPIGSTNENAALAALSTPLNPAVPTSCQYDFDGSTPATCDTWQINQVTYRKWTGRFVADYTPQLDFTDATLLYASYARGYKAGGFNPGVQSGNLGVQPSYGPESIDAYEVGTKNTILDGTMQVNGDFWYYNYKGLQVSKIVANTSVNENIDAKLYGVEGTLLWAPTSRWQFNLSLANTTTDIGNSSVVDPRDPTNGYKNALLVKDGTPSGTGGSNCVLYYNGAAAGSLPAGFYAPPGGVGGLASSGIPYTSYGNCTDPSTDMHKLDPAHFPAGAATYGQILAAQGFATSDPSVKGTYEGVPTSLKGKHLQNTPDFTMSVGAQYTQPLANDYHLIGRLDYYWQTQMFGRIFNRSSDKIPSWGVMNMQVTLNAPDELWYVRGYVKNVLDSNNMTGMYLTSPSSGLYTNVFYGNPRTYGIAIGTNF